jgi:cytochrome c oxidase subunit IV
MTLEKQTMEGTPKHGEETHTHDHTKWYIGTIIALFILTAITVYVAGFDFGSNFVNLMIAMAIATVKASLVVLFFMHLRWEKGINAIVFLSSIFFVGVFMVFTFLDINTRVAIEPVGPTEPGASEGFTPAPMPMYVGAGAGSSDASTEEDTAAGSEEAAESSN